MDDRDKWTLHLHLTLRAMKKHPANAANDAFVEGAEWTAMGKLKAAP
jgi:hypothetical protein